MTPDAFRGIAREALVAAQADPVNLRLVMSAVALADMLAAHVFQADAADNRAAFRMKNSEDDTCFREYLAKADTSGNFRLLRDLAKAQKHVVLTRGDAEIKRADQLSTRSLGYGQGGYGVGPYGGGNQLAVELDNGRIRNVIAIIEHAIEFLEARFF